ncbi:MAG: hypothetical protein MJY64_01930 [archaeon]|nr:hypothetical protein [archaeon]
MVIRTYNAYCSYPARAFFQTSPLFSTSYPGHITKNAFESNEFIFMIFILATVDKNRAKEVFNYYVKPQRIENTLKSNQIRSAIKGFEETPPVKYL